MQTVTVQMTNGVNVTQLAKTVDAVRANPSLGRFQFRCENMWNDGAHNTSTIQGFYGAGEEDTSRTTPFSIEADEPPVLLGQDVGANPVEYVLHALAACMTTSMVYHAAARGIRIGAMQCSLEGELDLRGFLGLDPSVRKGFEGIRATFDIQTDATAEQMAELAKMSPVRDTVSNPVPVSVDIRTTAMPRS
jgi:uncharacterized OsmC-like protein